MVFGSAIMIAVTGASGQLGRLVIAGLLEKVVKILIAIAIIAGEELVV